MAWEDRFCTAHRNGCRWSSTTTATARIRWVIPAVSRIHTDDSIEVRYYNKPESHGISKMAFSFTGDVGCEYGGGVRCHGGKGGPKQAFLGWMGYNRIWWGKDKYAITLGGGMMNNPGRYLTLLPPINGADAISGSPYFTANPGDKAHMWDTTLNFQWMPKQYITWWVEAGYRHSDIPYWTGRGGITPPGGNTGAPANTSARPAARPGPATSRRRTRTAAARQRLVPGSSPKARPPSAPASWSSSKFAVRTEHVLAGSEVLMKSKSSEGWSSARSASRRLLFLSGCGKVQADATAEAPPPAKVVPGFDVSSVLGGPSGAVPGRHGDRASRRVELVVTGTVNPDVSRNVPVVSLASGRVVAIHARLGDTVKKGQLLLTIRSDDVSGGFFELQKGGGGRNSGAQPIRARQGPVQPRRHRPERSAGRAGHRRQGQSRRGDHGRTSPPARQRPDHPNGMVDIFAPVSGVITDQQVTNAAGVQSLGTNPFTISDLSYVWIVCDVYENDLPNVRLGDTAEIRLNAYPDRVLKGTVSNIGAILDPNIRTAKVRIEVAIPGIMRLGMFVTATFRGRTKEMHTVVPASAILHLHDRDWVYVPAPDKKFRRVEVVSGDLLPDNLQEIKSGIKPGQQVVANALVLEHAIAINR